HHKVPSLDDWEIVLDLRPMMESYVKGTNDD
ncbi:MAG: bacteriocin, partial [Veillonella nakazawae]